MDISCRKRKSLCKSSFFDLIDVQDEETSSLSAASASAGAAGPSAAAPSITGTAASASGSSQQTSESSGQRTQQSKALSCLNLLCESPVLAPYLLQLLTAK